MFDTTDLANLDMSRTTREHPYGYSVRFPLLEEGLLTPMLSASLHQQEMSHDILIVKLKDVLSGSNRIVEVDNLKGVWIGHVYLIENASYAPSNTLTVTCVGNSYSMKKSQQQVYNNCTADMVASKIAKRNGLKTDTSRHPLVYKQLSQAGQSDWQMLVRLARQSGYGFRVENERLIFKSRDALHKAARKAPTYFKYVRSPSGMMTPYMSIYEFIPLMAEQAPELDGAGVSRSMGHLGSDKVGEATHNKKYNKYSVNSKKVSRHVRENHKAVFNKIITSEVAPTPAYSKTVLESIANTSAYRYKAKVRLRGTPSVRPYDVVYLDGLPEGMHGYWNVISVAHNFGENWPYYLDVEVGTDTLGESIPAELLVVTADVAGELAGEVITPSSNDFILDNSMQISAMDEDLRVTERATPVVYSTAMYNYMTPDFSEYASTMKWRAL
jgi:hypothetical protein